MTPLDATKRLCPNGHLMDPAWEVCPYCPSERRGGPDLARTVRIDEAVPAASERKAGPDLARTVRIDEAAVTAEDRRPAIRKTEILDPVTTSLAVLGWLVSARGPKRGETFRIDRDRVSLGAAADCDIVLDEAHISERHASIRVRDQEFVITDLDSTNGTFVNGEPVAQRALVDGDRVRLGSSEWVFKCLVFEDR